MAWRRPAAGLAAVLAVVVWNLRFDAGVSSAVRHYLDARAAYLDGRGPQVEMGPVMRAAAADAAVRATTAAAPLAIAALVLARPLRRRAG
ncbi:MAG TPA: hypothetical protein VF198_10115 [Vicinamibacterales bacterium]